MSECSERLSEACVCDCEVLIVMCAKKFPLYPLTLPDTLVYSTLYCTVLGGLRAHPTTRS